MQQPMSLRMPLVFEGSRAFSQDDVVTQTRALSPEANDGPFKRPSLSPSASPPPQSPPLPIMQFDEPSYFSNFQAGTSETVITATPYGSPTESVTWYMTALPYELEMDLYVQHPLTPRRAHECLEKAQSKFSKRSPGAKLHDEIKGSAFDKVVFTLAPHTTSKTGDIPPLDCRHLVDILGEAGLAGFYRSSKKYVETHFRIRDVSVAGRGRFVAFGKVKRGSFRGSRPGSGEGAQSPFPSPYPMQPASPGGGEEVKSPEFEAFKGRIDMMGLR